MLRRRWPFLLILALLLSPALVPAPAAGQEPSWEERFRALPDPVVMRQTMHRLAAHPHEVGSEQGERNAEWIRGRFEAWGLEARIERFDVLFPRPLERVVEMVEPTQFVASLQEPAIPEDPTSDQQDEQLPTYNAYSADGDVTAPLVYVNYGLPEDYEQLERLGVSVEGRIVIARYGRSWRGVKPKVAAEHGAVGCIIYSDPADDGYARGDVYPEGPMRPPTGVQRGSVMDITQHPGDPLTPDVGATEDADRVPVDESPAIQKIPVLPISYGDAQPLLEALTGPLAPNDFRGGLPITYHVGPGAAVVHLKVKASWDLAPAYDVIGMIRGSEFPDEWVVRGNHHDGWVNGAEDPISGLMCMLEEARGFGELVRQGWQPKRTIVFAAWDGEEPMLLGSTEWAEHHSAELRDKAVAYINSDTNGRGFLSAQGSPSMQTFINDVARAVEDPETGLSVWQRRHLADVARSHGAARSRAQFQLGALGSGTDYTAFVDHLGVASVNLGFGGEDRGGIYHSIYDTYTWYERFSDTDYVYGRALAQTAGTAVMRLADADLLPYDFKTLASTVETWAGQVRDLLADRQKEIAETGRELDEGVFAAVDDPREPTIAPERKEVPPYLNWAPLENAVDALKHSAADWDKVRKAAHEVSLSTDSVQRINALLIQSERRLTDDEGLPERPWYRNLLYAPGEYSGYGAKTLPGVREAIEQGKYEVAEAEIARLAGVLGNEVALIREVTTSLRDAAGLE